MTAGARSWSSLHQRMTVETGCLAHEHSQKRLQRLLWLPAKQQVQAWWWRWSSLKQDCDVQVFVISQHNHQNQTRVVNLAFAMLPRLVAQWAARRAPAAASVASVLPPPTHRCIHSTCAPALEFSLWHDDDAGGSAVQQSAFAHAKVTRLCNKRGGFALQLTLLVGALAGS